MQTPRSRVLSFTGALAFALAASGCTAAALHGASLAAAPALNAQSPADELYELSPARVHVRRLAPQAIRLLAPQWTRVRESDRKALEATLVDVLSEDRVAPFVRAHIKKAVDAHPELAASALGWLRSPLGYDVKFAEATAWEDDKSPEDTFYADVADARENHTPEIRGERIQRLAAATGALEKTLDLTSSVGIVVARLVNVARPSARPLALPALAAIVERERRVPDVAKAYTPVVTAALLVRCRDLDLGDLDRYIAFAATDAGRWYHDTIASSLTAGIADASMDVEGVFEVNAHSDKAPPESAGTDLDSLSISLPSGREVRLLAFAKTGPEAQPAVVLRYETSLPLHDQAAVRSEAAEVWEKVRPQVESGGARAAVLQATGSVEGWVFPFASSRKYGWRRDEAGAWTTVADAKSSFGLAQREMLWSVPP